VSEPQHQAANSTGGPRLKLFRVIEVTDGTVAYENPIWSPDGRKLAFIRREFVGISVRNADGSGPIREIASTDSLRCLFLWTPDSKALLCRLGNHLGRIDVETGKVDTLAGPLADRGQIHRNAYGDISFTMRAQAQSLDFETGRMGTEPYSQVKFLDPKTGAVMSAWEYYSGERPLSGDIRVKQDFRANKMWIEAGDGAARTAFPHRVILQDLSPTRDKVAFLQGDGNLHVAGLDGSSAVSVGRGSQWNWSQDGRLLVYLGAIKETEWNVIAAEIVVASADGSGATQITHTPDVIEDSPAWSPDGMSIAYSGYDTGKIYVAILEEAE
jgi:hypothetical protein